MRDVASRPNRRAATVTGPPDELRDVDGTQATVTLGDLGCTDVTELEGGMKAWRDDGRSLPLPDRAGRRGCGCLAFSVIWTVRRQTGPATGNGG